MKYFEAVKKLNDMMKEKNKDHKYIRPMKGTKEYELVLKLMKGETIKQPASKRGRKKKVRVVEDQEDELIEKMT